MGILIDNSGRLRTFWRLTIFFMGIVAIYFMVILALDGLFNVSRMVSSTSFQSFIASFYTSPMILHLDIALRATLSIGLVLICRRYMDQRPLVSLGFAKPGNHPWSSVHGGFLLGFLPVIVVSLILLAAGQMMFLEYRLNWAPFFMIPLLAVAAFYEELVYRGYLFQNFLDIRQPAAGIVITSLLFWLMHGLNDQVWSSPLISLNLFIGGVLLALAYQVSGNIWFPTALHMGWNYAQGGILGLPISGETLAGLTRLAPGPESSRLLTGGSFGIEGSILTTACEICVILWFVWLLRRRAGGNAKKTSP